MQLRLIANTRITSLQHWPSIKTHNYFINSLINMPEYSNRLKIVWMRKLEMNLGKNLKIYLLIPAYPHLSYLEKLLLLQLIVHSRVFSSNNLIYKINMELIYTKKYLRLSRRNFNRGNKNL